MLGSFFDTVQNIIIPQYDMKINIDMDKNLCYNKYHLQMNFCIEVKLIVYVEGTYRNYTNHI